MYKQQADSTNDQLINLSRAPYSHAVTHTHHSNRCTDHDWMSPGENHLQNPKGNTEITTHLDCQSSTTKTTKTPPSKPPETGLPNNPSGPIWIHVIQHPASLSAASWLMKSAGIWRRSCPREQSEQYSLGGVQAVKVRWHLVPCRQHQNQSMQGPCELLKHRGRDNLIDCGHTWCYLSAWHLYRCQEAGMEHEDIPGCTFTTDLEGDQWPAVVPFTVTSGHSTLSLEITLKKTTSWGGLHNRVCLFQQICA